MCNNFLHIVTDFFNKFRLGASTISDKNLEGFCSMHIYYSISSPMSIKFVLNFQIPSMLRIAILLLYISYDTSNKFIRFCYNLIFCEIISM